MSMQEEDEVDTEKRGIGKRGRGHGSGEEVEGWQEVEDDVSGDKGEDGEKLENNTIVSAACFWMAMY